MYEDFWKDILKLRKQLWQVLEYPRQNKLAYWNRCSFIVHGYRRDCIR